MGIKEELMEADINAYLVYLESNYKELLNYQKELLKEYLLRRKKYVGSN